MKKIFTLIFALISLTAVNAATVNDIVPLKSNYVLIFDQWNQQGTKTLDKGTLFGDDHFLAGTNKVAKNKGSWNSELDPESYGAGEIYNSWGIKGSGNNITFKVVEGTKVTIYHEKHASRTPAFFDATGTKIFEGTMGVGISEYTFTEDATISMYEAGSSANDIYLGAMVFEVPMPDGTPVAEVSKQAKGDDGIWYREVSAVCYESGEPLGIKYTLDGSEVTMDSPTYTEPIKIYKNQSVNLRGFSESLIMADLTGDQITVGVKFDFAAPAINVEGNTITITNAEDIDGAIKYAVNAGDTLDYTAPFTLEKSASLVAYTIIKNEKNDFVSNSRAAEALLMKPITETQTLIIEGDWEEVEAIDPETGEEKVDDSGNPVMEKKITAEAVYNDEYIFYRGFTLKAVEATGDQVQVDSVTYTVAFQLNDPGKLSFTAPEDKDIKVTAYFSINSHKNDDDMRCGMGITPLGGKIEYVVNGTYDSEDKSTEGGVDENNVVEYLAIAGNTYTISKWNNTGNMFISYMKFEPTEPNAIQGVAADKVNVSGSVYNLAGQKVSSNYRGIVIMNGKKMVK